MNMMSQVYNYCKTNVYAACSYVKQKVTSEYTIDKITEVSNEIFNRKTAIIVVGAVALPAITAVAFGFKKAAIVALCFGAIIGTGTVCAKRWGNTSEGSTIEID